MEKGQECRLGFGGKKTPVEIVTDGSRKFMEVGVWVGTTWLPWKLFFPLLITPLLEYNSIPQNSPSEAF